MSAFNALPGVLVWLALVGCGGRTTLDDAALQGEAAGAPGIDPSNGDAGRATARAPLVPLISGHVSTFVFAPLNPALPMIDTCDDPQTSMGEASVIDGQSGFLYWTFCGKDPFLLVGAGDQLTAVEIVNGHARQSFAYIHSPVAPGESWQSGTGELYTWRDAGSVLTAAGAFNNCWEREGRNEQLFYCRGAGLVRAIDTEFNYLLDLVQKSF